MDNVEQEIQAKAPVAPRLTPHDIESAIAKEFCITLDQALESDHSAHEYPKLKLFTVCVLVLRNGFVVTGGIRVRLTREL